MMCFLDTLSNVLVNCSTEDVLILGGDFNCSDQLLDRNQVEHHMPSRRRLIQLTSSNEIVDIWRNFHHSQQQYTWAHAHENLLSLARLDRFYGYIHINLIYLKSVPFFPIGFSDHSLVVFSSYVLFLFF